MAWEHLVFSKTQENLGVMGEVVDTTIKTVIQVEPIKVDKEIKTDVEGLWAPGKVTTQEMHILAGPAVTDLEMLPLLV